MRNKGKRRQHIYMIRRAEKKGEKRQKRHKGSSGYLNKSEVKSETSFMEKTTSQKVLRRLKEERFALNDSKLWFSSVTRIKMPKVFSISENPDETIWVLRRVYTVGRIEAIKKIQFDYSECDKMGLSASTILDIIVLALEQWREQKNWDWELEGNFPPNEEVRTILCASGLPYHLKVEPRWLLDEERIRRFQTVCGNGGGTVRNSSITATNLTNYFNDCVGTQGLELTDEGRRILSGIVGEVLDNCENHGGKEATWYTQGHYHILKNKEYGEMQLLFLSIGESIYDGLNNTDVSKETQDRLAYIKEKIKYRLDSQMDEELLYTILSLQEGISRLRDKNREGYAGRGSGTVHMIQFFEDIGETEEKDVSQQLTVLSGNSFITFDKEYKMHEMEFSNDKAFGSGKKQIIAFNNANDIYEKPDSRFVRKIKEHFPGTVISLRFYLDARYIRRKGLGD